MAVSATLRLRHHGCITQDFSSSTWISHVSSDPSGDVFVLHAPESDMPDLEARWQANLASYERLDAQPRIVVARGRMKPSSLMEQIARTGVIINWPATYAEGWEEYPLVAPTRDALRQVVEIASGRGEVKLLGTYEVPHEALDLESMRLRTLVAALTRRQLETICLAASTGYLRRPSATAMEELAARIGVAPSTVAEHIRKGRTTLMETIAREVQRDPALLDAATKTRGRPGARRS